jgi:hypothetical protein
MCAHRNLYANPYEFTAVDMVGYGYRSTIVMILAVQIIFLLSLAQPVLAEEILVQKAGTLSEGEYYADSFTGIFGENVKIVLESDEDVDLILTSVEGYYDYKDPGKEYFMSYSEGSSLRVKQTTLDFFLPVDGVYYVIVDNSDLPSSGAVPIGNVSYSVEVSRTGEPGSIATTLIACGIVTVIVFVVVTTVIYIYMIRPRQKEMAAKAESPVYEVTKVTGPMTCPTCGTYSTHGTYCAKCQRRLR